MILNNATLVFGLPEKPVDAEPSLPDTAQVQPPNQFKKSPDLSEEEMTRMVVGPHWGNCNGEPIWDAPIYETTAVNLMSQEELRSALLEIQMRYEQMREKLWQLRANAQPEIIKRDPYVADLVTQGIVDGKNDVQIAAELGEKVRFVQDMRLALSQYRTDFKRPAGRPRKHGKTP